ncbi:MAG: hemolysin III family protein [Devosia sp.]
MAGTTPARPFSRAELIADGVIHGLGITHAIGAGIVLIVFASIGTARPELPAIVLYLVSLVAVLGISMMFNLAPASGFKRAMDRLDKAAIFLLIAATYTPFLALLGGTPGLWLLLAFIWASALAGVALRLVDPPGFSRVAILLYLGIGWSGILVFGALLAALPPAAFWLVLAGGLTYSAGIVFHLWERLKFHNALWHAFVVAGTVLHLWALMFCFVLGRP